MKRAFTVIASSLAAVSVAAAFWGGGPRPAGSGAVIDEPRVIIKENGTDVQSNGEERGSGRLREEERKPDVGAPPTTEPHYGTPPLGGPDGGILEAIPDRDGSGKGDAGR